MFYLDNILMFLQDKLKSYFQNMVKLELADLSLGEKFLKYQKFL